MIRKIFGYICVILSFFPNVVTPADSAFIIGVILIIWDTLDGNIEMITENQKKLNNKLNLILEEQRKK